MQEKLAVVLSIQQVLQHWTPLCLHAVPRLPVRLLYWTTLLGLSAGLLIKPTMHTAIPIHAHQCSRCSIVEPPKSLETATQPLYD